MKTKRYSTKQNIGILKEAEAGMPVKELCRKYGVSDAQRLKELVADIALDIQMLKKINSKKW